MKAGGAKGTMKFEKWLDGSGVQRLASAVGRSERIAKHERW